MPQAFESTADSGVDHTFIYTTTGTGAGSSISRSTGSLHMAYYVASTLLRLVLLWELTREKTRALSRRFDRLWIAGQAAASDLLYHTGL